MSEIKRLDHHQAHSGPLMEQLQQWGQQQLDEHRVEPNSGLGQAITYMLKHWEKLTLFLRKAGAPLDSNIVERALKKAILPSVITSKAAIHNHLKTGQRGLTQD
jgi:hypothetical protein